MHFSGGWGDLSCAQAPSHHPKQRRTKRGKGTVNKLGIEGRFFNLIKGYLFMKSPQLPAHSGARWKAFPLRSGARQGCLLSPLLFNSVLEALPQQLGQEKELKGIQIGKEGKSSLLADGMVTCIEKILVNIQRLLKLINRLSKVAGNTINTQKSVVFVYTHDQQSKNEIKKKKSKIFGDIFK